MLKIYFIHGKISILQFNQKSIKNFKSILEKATGRQKGIIEKHGIKTKVFLFLTKKTKIYFKDIKINFIWYPKRWYHFYKNIRSFQHKNLTINSKNSEIKNSSSNDKKVGDKNFSFSKMLGKKINWKRCGGHMFPFLQKVKCSTWQKLEKGWDDVVLVFEKLHLLI